MLNRILTKKTLMIVAVAVLLYIVVSLSLIHI